MAVWPVPRAPDGRMPVISSHVGPRESSYHEGVDIMWKRAPTDGGPPKQAALPELSPLYYLRTGTPAVAFEDGVVTHVDTQGKPLRVRIDHGSFASQYLHLFTADVKPGQRVRAGQRLGVIGHNPTGYQLNHLHFELIANGRKIDPEPTLMTLPAVPYPSTVPWKPFAVAVGLAAAGIGGYWLWRNSLKDVLAA